MRKEPIVNKTLESSQRKIIYQVYRVKAGFKEKFNFRNYPFDTQKLAMLFRHTKLTHHNLIYVVDFPSMKTGQALLEKFDIIQVFGNISDWKIKEATFFQNIATNESTLGNPSLFGSDSQFQYSRFNAVIEIKRDILSFITKNLLPLLFLVGISYFIRFSPFEEIYISTISGILVAVAFFHLSLISSLPEGIGYAVALDYAFYAIYGLIVFQIIMVVIGQQKRIKENSIRLKRLLRIAWIAYPIIVVVVIIFAVYFYS